MSRKKEARDLTTQEAAKRLFPKRVIEEVRKQVGPSSPPPSRPPSQPSTPKSSR